jgi:hypothetical protein
MPNGLRGGASGHGRGLMTATLVSTAATTTAAHATGHQRPLGSFPSGTVSSTSVASTARLGLHVHDASHPMFRIAVG